MAQAYQLLFTHISRLENSPHLLPAEPGLPGQSRGEPNGDKGHPEICEQWRGL